MDRIPASRPSPFLHPDAEAPAPKRARHAPDAAAEAAVGGLQGLARPPALPDPGSGPSGSPTRRPPAGAGRAQRLQELQALRERSTRDSASVPSPTLPLAGYLLARRLDGRPVDTDGIRRLRDADEAIAHARASMAVGRGNVDVDVRETGGKSRVHLVAAREMVNDWDRDGVRLADAAAVDFHVKRAAASLVFGAGSCTEHASLALLAYGKEGALREPPSQERVQAVHQRSRKHGWAEVRPAAGSSGRVVLDPWADGPAVFAEDSRFAKDRSAVSLKTSLGVAEAAEGHRLAVQAAQAATDERPDEIEGRRQQAADWLEREWAAGHGAEWARTEWRPQPVLDDALADRTRHRLQSLQAEVHAVGVAMSLGSVRVRDVVRDVPRIVEATRQLPGVAADGSSSVQGPHRNEAGAEPLPP